MIAINLRIMNQRKYTPLYKKGIKQNQNRPMETTPHSANQKKKKIE